MQYKTKKILTISSAVVGVSAVLATGIGLYFSIPASVRIPEKNLFVVRSNVKQDTTGYKYDYSNSYGTALTGSPTTLIGSELIHLKTEGEFSIKKDASGKETIEPSYQSYQFGLANAAVLVFESKTKKGDKFELVFDSDAVDDNPKSQLQPNNTQTVVDRDSSDPKSINNKKIFLKLLSTGAMSKKVDKPESIQTNDILSTGDYIITKLGFTVNTEARWVDSQGQPTKYNLDPRDFWYSFMRSKLTDKDYRRSNGGSQDLDSYFVDKTSTTTRFQENDRFSNEYLFNFFDLDSTKLYNESDAIQKVKINGQDKEMFTFSSLTPTKPINGFLSVFENLLANNLLFIAAPSQYIKELAANDNLNKNLGDKNLEIKDKAKEFGTYTYGQTRESTLYASPYIPTSAIENREVYEFNHHFANQQMVDEVEGTIEVRDPNTNKKVRPVEKVIFEYTGGIDTSTFNSQLLSSYLKGNVSQIAYATLTPDQRIKIFGTSGDQATMMAEAEKNGLQYVKTNNLSSLVQRTLVQSNPTNAVKSLDEYTFNDKYSQLVFGMSRQELQSGQKTTTDAFFVNDGFEFRTLIQASINWDAYIKQVYQHQRVLWLNGAAQNAQFSNSTKDEKNPTPLDNYEEVNTLQFIDNTNTKNGLKLESVTPEEMRKHTSANKDDNKKALQSPKFSKIQENVKKLLDKVYAQNKWRDNEKIEWEVVYPYADQQTLAVTIMQDVVNMINSLDERLNAKLFVPKNAEEMLNKIARNTGVSDFNGWGYDYEGIGSYFAAFSNGTGVTILNAFAIFSEDTTKIKDAKEKQRIEFLQSSFPEFTKMSKFIKEKVDQELKDLEKSMKKATGAFKDLYVENWKNVTNAQNQEIDEYFKSKTNGQYKISVHLSKLLREYEEYKPTSSNGQADQGMKADNWAKLIKETNAIKGVSTDPDNSIADPSINGLNLYLREYVIPITKKGVQYFQDYRIEKE